MLRSWLLGVALATMAVCASAQVYEWRDEQGRLIYGDMPPVGVDARLVRSATPAATPAPQASPTAAERELQRREEQADRAEAVTQEAAARERAAELERSCGQARGQLVALESGQRVARFNEQGEREFLTEEQRSEEIERTQRFITENCQ